MKVAERREHIRCEVWFWRL